MSMQRNRRMVNSLIALAFLIAGILETTIPASAQAKSLMTFSAGYRGKIGPGSHPYANVIRDAAGNLYGTTNDGGFYAGGTAYELIADQDYEAKVLHSFGGRLDGYFSFAGLLLDASGNLYGTTSSGGLYGWGTVFELSPTSGGDWTEKILHSFTSDNIFPFAALIMDTLGNLYGTTEGDLYSTTDCGSVFELHRTPGAWAFKMLHQFKGPDGCLPSASLVFDSAGNLYGTSQTGGLWDTGTVFELSPISGGKWAEKILHACNFYSGQDGGFPRSGLTVDAAGHLYGTTWQGGTNYLNFGTVFELSPGTNGSWTETILHTFYQFSTDGMRPSTGVVLDEAGNLYGTTDSGGIYSGGIVYRLVPSAGGPWDEQVIYSFVERLGEDNIGSFPHGVGLDAGGNIYGTATDGGARNDGTVFTIGP